MATVSGNVEWAGTNKFGGYSIKVGGNFYNTKFDPKLSVGQFVEFDDGGKKYINNPKVLASGPAGASAPSPSLSAAGGAKRYRNNGEEGGFPIHPFAYERTLDRRNALQCATQLVSSCEIDREHPAEAAEDIIAIARMFEAYSTGDWEREQAEKLFGSVVGE